MDLKMWYTHMVEHYWTLKTCYNMDVSWKHYVKEKKPVPRDYKMYDYKSKESKRVSPELGRKEERWESRIATNSY